MQAVSRIHSLSTKLLISTLLWLTCAVVFTGYTLALLWQLENGGEAINKAGSLRMRVYHLVLLGEHGDGEAMLREQQKFSEILSALQQLDGGSFLLPRNLDIGLQIDRIQQNWQTVLLPRLQGKAVSVQGLAQFDGFVDEINQLVSLLEQQNTYHIIWLRFFQTLLIMMVFLSAFVAIYLLFRVVIRPLRIIQEGIQELSQGHLAKRIEVVSRDEFGAVSAGFNVMAGNLEDFYGNLEQKVHEKTLALEEKNQELSTLYRVTAFLHESTNQEYMAQGFLDNVLLLSGADAGMIRLIDRSLGRLKCIASKNLPEAYIGASRCLGFDCHCGQSVMQFEQIFSQQPVFVTSSVVAMRPQHCMESTFGYLINFHIYHKEHYLGVMTLFFVKEVYFLPSMQHLVESLTRQLAVSLENQVLVQSDKQLAVLRERNFIAQGLHDSIAQSLSFLNMQIQMMQKAFVIRDMDQVGKNLSFIQKGVQECYDDVRELLLNFRVSVANEDFVATVNSLLERFKRQTKLPVVLDMESDQVLLAPQQQLQVVFILQEALSNIRKHARCSVVRISFTSGDGVVMRVLDDGCGFALDELEQKKSQHVGLSIMQERAEQIGAQVEVVSKKDEGTCIILTVPNE